jgi:anaphase-promoting complex subunit 1
VAAYDLVGRNDLAEGLNTSPEPLFQSGYRSVKDYVVSIAFSILWVIRTHYANYATQLPTFSRKSVSEHVDEVRRAISGELPPASAAELEQEDFTQIRFGQDRRVEEVARLLSSSKTAVLKTIERPELK